MKLAVTGGHGFFGFNFISYLIEKNIECEIVNIDNKKNINSFKKNKNYKFFYIDVTDYKKTLHILKNVDYVIHFAGVSTITKHSGESINYTKNNILGTHNLIEAARGNQVKKFILISSCEVHENRVMDFNFPRNIYTASKIGAEAILISYYNAYDFPAIIIRSTNLFGPFQTADRIISSSIAKLLNGQKITLMGNGKNKRDYLYVKDACEAVCLVLEKGKIGNIYNLSSGTLISNLEVADKILRYFNKDDTWIDYLPERNVNDCGALPKDRKINKLGWKKRYAFDIALRNTIEWYKANYKNEIT